MRLTSAGTMVLIATVVATAVPASASARSRSVSVRELACSGDWRVDQDYGEGRGVRFDQHFEFSRVGRSTPRIPLAGGSVKVPLRVVVTSNAAGAFSGASGELVNYTCAATSSRTVRVTVSLAKRGSRWRVTAAPLRRLVPGDPQCTEPGAAFWPTGDAWFAGRLRERATLAKGSLRRPVALAARSGVHDCGGDFMVGTCAEQLTWAGALRLSGAARVSPATAGIPGDPTDRHPLYVAMGDSWAAGLGASSPSEGYVPQLHAALQCRLDCRTWHRPGCKRLGLVSLGQAGATTPWLIESQLPAAVALLERHNGDRSRRNDVKVVTLHIGGNDVVSPILAACPAEVGTACAEVFASAMAQYRRDLETVFRSLRAAAGRRTRLVIGTYARVIVPPCPFPPVVDLIAEGDVRVGPGLYDVMRDVARRYHADVADVAESFGPGDLAGDCRHPNDSGYDKVTAAFLDVLLRAG